MANKIEVVLLQSVKWLGNKDDIVSVAIPYAKNVLFSQGKAKPADKQALDAMKQKQEKQIKHEQENKDIISALKEWIELGTSLKVHKNATPQGHLYEKLSIKDVQMAIKEACNLTIDAQWIDLKEKIDAIGEYKISVVYKWQKLLLPLSIH